MGNLLFSPSGRIDSGSFMQGATVLVVIALVLALLAAFIPALAVLNVVAIVTYWCWVVLWVKRYHDGGKSGWMCLIPIIVYLVLGGIAGYLLTKMFTDPDAAAAIAEAAASGDFAAILKSAGGGALTSIGKIVVPLGAAAVSYGIAFLFNGMIKGDAHDNQFGPQT